MKLKLAVVVGLVAVLMGCAHITEGYVGKSVGGLVRYTNADKAISLYKEACNVGTARHEYCREPSKFNLLSVSLNRDSSAHYTAQVPVPISVAVGEDSIIMLHVDSIISQFSAAGGFIKVAAKPDNSNCKWKGSKIFTSGGVVCPREGYDYRDIVK